MTAAAIGQRVSGCAGGGGAGSGSCGSLIRFASEGVCPVRADCCEGAGRRGGSLRATAVTRRRGPGSRSHRRPGRRRGEVTDTLLAHIVAAGFRPSRHVTMARTT
ncbi:hypothetical protein Slala05_41640 [Streptomyces lavendulae subsp. lavendulae]|nr:hypothetical protein Slala05_41640 [Streptomyces lavendulae subsp. lavendulae]